MEARGCAEVEQGEAQLLVVEAFRDHAPMIEDPWGPGLDWLFPLVLGRARLATVYDEADEAFHAYRMGHPGRPPKIWRKATEVKASFYGLDLLDLPVAHADQILKDLANGMMDLENELKQVEAKGGQGALLPSSCGGTAVLILERYFEDCVEFGQVIELDPDSLVP